MKSLTVYLRPLKLEDAQVSYQWRNNPEIWKYTGARPDKFITPEIETRWLENCLSKTDEHRFAICLKQNNRYIGNIQLINIQNQSAQFHLFIGEQQFWGKGIGKKASALMLEYAFEVLKLESVTLTVNKDNVAANEIYQKLRFQRMGISDSFIEMVLTRKHYNRGHILKLAGQRLSKMASSLYMSIAHIFELM